MNGRRGWGRRDLDGAETALANFALTFAKALLVLCVVLFALIADEKKAEDGVRPKIEAMIMVDWTRDAGTDVDTWVRDASGRIVFFGNKEAGATFLDRDDLGTSCVSVCEELVSLRGLVSGEYVVNLNVYAAPERSGASSGEGGPPAQSAGAPLKAPLTVHVRIMTMNPQIATPWEQDVVLHAVKEEKHVVRFRIEDGRLGGFDSSRPVLLLTHPGR